MAYLWNERSPSLTGYRPNQAANRVYAGWASPREQGANLSGMGDDVSVDPKLLLGGIGLLALGMFIFGGKAAPKMRARKVARLQQRRARISQQLAALGG